MNLKQLARQILGPSLSRRAAKLKTQLTLLRTRDIIRRYDGGGLRLIGFIKSYNEGENGNLERCLKHLSRFCDDIALCDDSSTDNSLEVAKKYTGNIIAMPNDFRNELQHKQKLLELTLSLKPSWIVWLDPDETFDRAGESAGIRALCEYGEEHGVDSFSFLYHNIWKSRSVYRVDERWRTNWQPKLWRNNCSLRFDLQEGLHLRQYPSGLMKDRRTDIKVIHYGFSTEELVKRKYETYISLGQSGRDLERIIDEEGIRLKRIDVDWLPLSTLKVTVVCLVFRSIGYINFVYDSYKRHTGDADFLFVANDPTEEVLNYLKEKNIPHLVHRNPDPAEYYINRVYRAWNYGGFNAPGDILIFVNSDMAFSRGWCENLLKHLRRDRIVTSRLVESGKLRSGRYGIEKDFGRTYREFDEEGFEAYAEQIKSDELKKGGLFMPCALYKDIFVKSGGYPKGNRVDSRGRVTSGDRILFYETLASMGVKHYTAFDSIVYHIQEGEQDAE